MRQLITSIIIVACFATANAQRRPGHNDFNRIKMAIEHNHDGRSALNVAEEYVIHHPVTTNQLIELCMLFQKEIMRYNLCLAAYPMVSNKDQFFKVYNVFTKLSHAMKLYHNTQAVQISGHTDHHIPEEPSQRRPQASRNYNDIAFPDAANYQGIIGSDCRIPIPDYDFEIYLNQYRRARKNDNIVFLKSKVDALCLSTSQLMKLALELSLESQRLEFLKYASTRCFDIENFEYAAQTITHSYYKEDLLNHITSQINNYRRAHCMVNDIEFNRILRDVKLQRFAEKQIEVANEYITNECFSMLQIRQIVRIFNFDDDKLEVLMYAYNYAPKPEEMGSMQELLKFESSKIVYDRFLREQRR